MSGYNKALASAIVNLALESTNSGAYVNPILKLVMSLCGPKIPLSQKQAGVPQVGSEALKGPTFS